MSNSHCGSHSQRPVQSARYATIDKNGAVQNSAHAVQRSVQRGVPRKVQLICVALSRVLMCSVFLSAGVLCVAIVVLWAFGELRSTGFFLIHADYDVV